MAAADRRRRHWNDLSVRSARSWWSSDADRAGLAAGGLWGVYEGFRRPLTRATPSASFTLASLNAPYKRAAEAAAAAAGGSAAAAASAVPPPGAASAPFAAAAPPPPMGQAAGTSSATAPPGASAGSAPAAAARASPTMKLRLNTILNSATARGTFLGNNAGVLGAPAQLRSATDRAQRSSTTRSTAQSTDNAGGTTSSAA